MALAAWGEHEFEAEHGLPEPLPPGERLLWQGSPAWRRLAADALHWRKVAVYFVLLLGWQALTVTADGGSVGAAALAALRGVPLALLALGLLGLLAWLMARSAVYTVTDRRVVMRIGVVLTVSFNLPLSQIVAADMRARSDGSGDIALTLAEGQRIGWLHLWPHVRPWRVAQSQPMLRAVPDVARVARLLTEAVRDRAAHERTE
jgi:hypothetical protein